ncbi:MAG: ATP-binding protein [Saprospiraceae bacterium]
MIHRTSLKSLQRSILEYPVTVVTGPRQSGKTTLLRSLKDYRYVSLEDPDNRAYAEDDPRGFLSEYDTKVILDEVQNVPKLFSYIQGIVDNSGIMGQYILSGSQNFNLMERITQSLAGRADILELLPLDLSELRLNKLLPKDPYKLCAKGFYPAIYNREIDATRYYANYITTYINRDVTQLINLHDNNSFRKCLKICASRAGQLVNYNHMARDVGVSHTTLRNWLSILETSYIIHFLQPYYKNYAKRVIKSPKLYFWDTGVLSYLLGIRNGNLQTTHSSWGAIFENLIITEFKKKSAHEALFKEYWFWRDSKGHEVDLLSLNDQGNLDIIEIKSSSTIKTDHFKGLDYFEKISRESPIFKNLIYGGIRDQSRTKVEVKAWHNLFR